MKRSVLLAALMLAPVLANAAPACVDCPDRSLTVCADVQDGQAVYRLARRGQPLLAWSRLGLAFANLPNLPVSALTGVKRRMADSTWEQPWGEQRLVRDRHNEMRVSFDSTDARLAHDVVFRLFDDGLGFRYDFNRIPAGAPVAISTEHTEFNFTDSYQAWWFEANDRSNLEALYLHGKLDTVRSAETPFTLAGKHVFLSVHQAALVDYATMYLERTGGNHFRAALYKWSDGSAVRKTGPFTTPWRVLLAGKTPGALADSRLVLNLNEPNTLADTSWIKPMKYLGVWWEIHLGKGTWSSGPGHAANTANVKHYMDYAARHGFGGVLVEGWNVGWDGDWGKGDAFRFTEPYPDFDMAAITAHGARKGVQLIGHHETAGATENYGRQLDDAMRYYDKFGVRAVKTGYVANAGAYPRTDSNGKLQHETYGGQYMVNFHQRATEAAAAQRISVVVHEPVIDTGLRRTWPNILSREGARGQEYNAWGKPTNPPEHVTVLPFTRMLAGPMDFTPGIFDLTFGKTAVESRVQSTLANQLALYVVLYSPVQMAADMPQNYDKFPDAFEFIKAVPVDWEQSRTLASVIGNYAVVARQQRGAKHWYLGAVNDEQARSLDVALDFLAPGKRYQATIWRDADDADYRTKPQAYKIERRTVTARDRLKLALAPGGGAAVRFTALD